MASKIMSYRVLICDRCGIRFREADAQKISMAEVRARAYEVGWRFPVKGSRHEDICPECGIKED